MMKRLFVAMLGLSVLSVAAADVAEPVKEPQPAVCPQKPAVCPKQNVAVATGKTDKETSCNVVAEKNGNLDNIARGLTNMATCFLEVPRCIIVRNNEVPLFGFISGAVEGTGNTAMRAFSGATDVVLFGFLGKNIYGKSFPEFIWESNWKPAQQ